MKAGGPPLGVQGPVAGLALAESPTLDPLRAKKIETSSYCNFVAYAIRRVLFSALAALQLQVEQDAYQRFAVVNGTLFDHLQNVRKFD